MCLEPANKLRFRFEGYRIDDEPSTAGQGGKSLVEEMAVACAAADENRLRPRQICEDLRRRAGDDFKMWDAEAQGVARDAVCAISPRLNRDRPIGWVAKQPFDRERSRARTDIP